MSAERLDGATTAPALDIVLDTPRRVHAETFTLEDLVPGVVIVGMAYYAQLTAALPRLAEAMIIHKAGSLGPYDLGVYPTKSGEPKSLAAEIKSELQERKHNGGAWNFTLTMRPPEGAPEVIRCEKRPEELWFFDLNAEVHSGGRGSIASLHRDMSLYIAYQANTEPENYCIWIASRLVNGNELAKQIKDFNKRVAASAVYGRDLISRAPIY